MEFNATFLVSIISFLVFMYIMNEIFYEPLTKIIDEREGIVRDNYAYSERVRAEVSEIETERENRLAETAKQSRQIMIDKTNEANSDYKNRIADARTKSNQRIDVLKQELARSESDAKTVLDSQVEDLAQSIVNKVLQGGLNG